MVKIRAIKMSKFKKICMGYRVKVATQNIISLLPKSIGFKINKIFVEIAIGDIRAYFSRPCTYGSCPSKGHFGCA